MAPKDVRDYLYDMPDDIATAERLMDGGMTFEEFEQDKKPVLALTRAVEIVTVYSSSH